MDKGGETFEEFSKVGWGMEVAALLRIKKVLDYRTELKGWRAETERAGCRAEWIVFKSGFAALLDRKRLKVLFPLFDQGEEMGKGRRIVLLSLVQNSQMTRRRRRLKGTGGGGGGAPAQTILQIQGF
ncbi:hypothetical protein CEXT_663401 [Caerostris extrusa]|uniref:Uncharacterized protein n=1 Tax=Caerostris extrusa TaxID=172846 RepID=A0AAV4RUK4_CAEEX|nr:hypothetical protein CEXT_663401 [Caerostris extrusa]